MKTDLARSRARKARRVERVAESSAISVALGIILPDPLKSTAKAPLRHWGSRDVTFPINQPKRPRKAKRKKSPTLSKLKKLLWHEISLLVRSWSRVCVACDLRPTECAAHIVPSNEGAATRFFLPNLYPCCVICNGLENWNRANWVYIHKKRFGDEFVDALFAFSETTFQLKKDWVLEQTERMRKLRGA